MVSASGNSVQVIANLVQTSPDRVREVIHAFNEKGLDCLDLTLLNPLARLAKLEAEICERQSQGEPGRQDGSVGRRGGEW